MKASAAWCMTASSGEKPWHGRTSTGRPRTPGYTTRPSWAAPRPSRCNHCLHDDHVTSLCPRNPNQPWFPDMLSWPGASFQQGHRPLTPRAFICRRWNEGRCKFQAGKYRHECLACGGPHMALECHSECPQRRSNPRSRSPVRGVARQLMFGPGQQMMTPGARGPECLNALVTVIYVILYCSAHLVHDVLLCP